MVRELLTRTDDAPYISRPAVVEVPSAFAGKVSTEELTVAGFELLGTRFFGDLRHKVLRTAAIKYAHFRDAGRPMETHGVHSRLRTLDAIQLAVALEKASVLPS